TA
ncbi:hypothetical protein BVZ80_01986B, partial [Haemophilus influenzae]